MHSCLLLLQAPSASVTPNVVSATWLPKLMTKVDSACSTMQVSSTPVLSPLPSCHRSSCESESCRSGQEKSYAERLECSIDVRESKSTIKLDRPLGGSECAAQSPTPVSCVAAKATGESAEYPAGRDLLKFSSSSSARAAAPAPSLAMAKKGRLARLFKDLASGFSCVTCRV